MNKTPTISKVYITSEPRDISCGMPGNRYLKTVMCHVVETTWSGADRTDGYGISCADNLRLANRLKAAITAGVVFTNPVIKTDINRKTYVTHDINVSGRRLDADLIRLGF